jgi:DNA polymerase III gamma/tau subunit
LFLGASESAALETAKELTKALFCEDVKDWESCDICRSCKLVSQNTHADFVKVSPIEDSQVVKIGQIRELVVKANLKPYEARSKVFVVDPADAMNEEAQNAFLKTLEEPQGDTHFILIARNSGSLLETIRSRCQAFHFADTYSAAEDEDEILALKREAVEIFLSKGARRVSSYPDLSKFEREEVSGLLDHLMQYFRDCLMIQAGADTLVMSEDDLIRKRRVAEEKPGAEIEDLIEFFSEIKEKVSSKVNLKLAATVLWEAAS